MSDELAPQRYTAVALLLDPDRLPVDRGDLMYRLESAVCDMDDHDHDCPLVSMSMQTFTEDQMDMLLAEDAERLRAAGWVVLSPAEREAARRLGPVVVGAPARPYRRPRAQS